MLKTKLSGELAADLAANGVAALKRIRETAYDIVLMDCHMPVMDGFELIQAVPPGMVAHPTLGCVDAQGRLFVGDSPGTNWGTARHEADKAGRIVMLEDRDGDGVFEAEAGDAHDVRDGVVHAQAGAGEAVAPAEDNALVRFQFHFDLAQHVIAGRTEVRGDGVGDQDAAGGGFRAEGDAKE